ncbi:BBSome-interacting protein 1 isoform X1 [Ovis aries]|nr:BBSome-interacting protein 1 isoform X1 [Ovis aries]
MGIACAPLAPGNTHSDRSREVSSSVGLSEHLSVIFVIPGWIPKAARGKEKSGELSGEPRNKNQLQQSRHSTQDETVSNTSDMAETKSMFREVLPKQGQLYVEDITTMVLCKPKLLPLKSLTLEKLEKMQQAAQDTIRQQEMTEKEQKITH